MVDIGMAWVWLTALHVLYYTIKSQQVAVDFAKVIGSQAI